MTRTTKDDDWPDVISVPDEDFQTAEEGVNYFAARTETLRATLLERNDEKAELEWALFKYKAGFWVMAGFSAGLVVGGLWIWMSGGLS